MKLTTILSSVLVGTALLGAVAMAVYLSMTAPATAQSVDSPSGDGDLAWGKPVDGLAIGLISSRTRPLGSTVPELLAFFRNDGRKELSVVRSSGFFALELNGQLFGPFDLNGKASQLTSGERLGPVTIEPAKLRELSKLGPGERPADDSARPRLGPGKNSLRVIYWHDKKPVYSGEVRLDNQLRIPGDNDADDSAAKNRQGANESDSSSSE